MIRRACIAFLIALLVILGYLTAWKHYRFYHPSLEILLLCIGLPWIELFAHITDWVPRQLSMPVSFLVDAVSIALNVSLVTLAIDFWRSKWRGK